MKIVIIIGFHVKKNISIEILLITVRLPKRLLAMSLILAKVNLYELG